MTARPTNRLAHETSPYLLQHAHNPVDWSPWGPEALGRAKAEDRPILLSVGYAACHWCHVMERESFEDPGTARAMNERFVCIKVDREERPDLDQLYQTAVQILGGHGGWPLTMFLTPDLQPFFGGTYFPPVRRHGMPAFAEVLHGVSEAWRQRRAQVDSSADQLTEALRDIERGAPSGGGAPLSREAVARAADALVSRFDADHGGFGAQPKFPNSLLLELWLRHGAGAGGAAFTDRVAFTLERMALAGIYDQLGGGFHRYSTDERWLVPHFEKMLYDNALLLRLYAQAFQATRNPLFARVLRESAEWVLREMTSPEGGFHSTQDADSEGEEGRFFVWDEAEIRAVVGGQDAPVVARVFGVQEGGNFEHGKSVLHRPVPLDAAAKLEGREPAEVEAIMDRARRQLFEAREARVHPGPDDKVLAGWNGLMIHGLCAAGLALGESRFVDAARRCSEFVASHLWDGDRLLRTWRAGRAKITAFSEDHAFLAEGELALFEATGDALHFERARRLADLALARFFDAPGGGFFVTAEGGEPILERPRSQYDNAVPSATSSMAHVLLRLHALTGDGRYADAAESTLRRMQETALRNPFGFGYLLCALEAATAGVGTLVVSGRPGDPSREELLAEARGRYAPNVVVVPLAGAQPLPAALAPLLEGKLEGAPAAYFCRAGTCSAPAKTRAALATLLGS